MPAHEHVNGVQFSYGKLDRGGKPLHQVVARRDNRVVGTMNWSAKEVKVVDVHHSAQRQGIATGMWNEGQRLAAEHGRIPAPKHSPDRTDAGDAWAKSVGGRLPRRSSWNAD